MPKFRTVKAVRHGPEAMFDLVADVERYPEFLPLCESLRVLKRVPGEEGRETLIADMGVGYKAIREHFTTRVGLDRPALHIVAAYVDGPFRHLENHWRFAPQGAGCAVDFAIDYEFRNRMLGMLMGTMFDRAFRRFTDAFEARADQVYGVPAASGA